MHRLGGEHAALHRGMRTLDLGEVQRAGIASDQQSAREAHLRQRLRAALGDGARAIAQALAALEELADHRMLLVALEFLERADEGIAVAQIGDQPERDLVVLEVIEESAAERAALLERPAGAVDHQPLTVLLGLDFPQFLDAEAVMLRAAAGVEAKALDQLLAEVAAAAFGEQRVLCMQFHAGRVAVLVLAGGRDAGVAGGDALHAAVFVEQDFRGGEAGVDLHAEVFGLLAEPAAEVAEADDVVALVVHRLRHQHARHLDARARAAQHIDLVLGDRRVERRAECLPIREQLVQRRRFEHRAGEDVRSDLGTLLDHADADVARELAQPAGSSQAGRAGTHDHDVVLHGFSSHGAAPKNVWTTKTCKCAGTIHEAREDCKR